MYTMTKPSAESFCSAMTSNPSEPIDEITVYGEKSLIYLEKEVDIAQESMFEVFNTLNTNDSFEVECRYQTRLDTRRRYLACVPKFMRLPPARIGSSYSYVREGEDDPIANSSVLVFPRITAPASTKC